MSEIGLNLADTANQDQGSLDDEAVQGDNPGTVSAKLRGLNKSIAEGLPVGVYNAVAPTLTDGEVTVLQTDVNGNLKVSGGGGGGGGAVTVADGADAAQGTTTDAAYSGSGAGTLISILKTVAARLAKGVATSAGSLSVVLASDQAAVPTNPRLLTASDVVALQGGTIVLAQLYDAAGSGLRVVSPTGGINQLQANLNEISPAIANWTGSANNVTTTVQTYGPINSRNFRELVIAVNISAVNTGVTFTYSVQDGNGIFLPAWTETFSATGNQYISIGPGYNADTSGTAKPARNISMGSVGQLTVVATGTNATIKGTAWMRTN